MTAARKLEPQSPFLETGRVQRVHSSPEGSLVEVQLAAGAYEAKRAKSCLVAPEAGDRVLCAIEQDRVFVLAVLEGLPNASTRLCAEGDLQVLAPNGRIAMCSSQAVDIAGAQQVVLSGGDLQLRAKTGSVAVERLGFCGRVLSAQIGKVALLAQELDTRLDRLTQRAKRVFRFVEDIEQLRAGTVDMRADNLAAVRGQNTVVAARTLAKIDGEQVHIG